jgi:hypothetical protein
MTDASTASIGGPNPTGWSTEDLFVHYLQHFITSKKPCKEDPALLILDEPYTSSHPTVRQKKMRPP